MLRLQRRNAAEQQPIRVVADQIGSPTHTQGLADFCWHLITSASEPAQNVLHWADAGVASWFDFAVAIAELGEALGLIHQQVPVVPITTLEYPTAAQRPHFSVLGGCGSTGGPQPQHWRQGLHHTLAESLEERG
jgi:dTDP-4-dehydrorhamnose reductase